MSEKVGQQKRFRKLKINTKKKAYQFSDSPFYRLRSKKRLADILQVDLQALSELAGDDLYRVFQDTSGRKPRQIEQPLSKLDKVHTRIASLLCRLVVPDYLHSGVKGRTYITNAKAHLGEVPVLTTDIRSFFPSTSAQMIERFFLRYFECSPDVAYLLSKISSFDGHVPTGSRLSMPIAFWANFHMFQNLNDYCKRLNVVMSVYVDDLCFSGEAVSDQFYRVILRKVEGCGHKIHKGKTKLYSGDQHKMITGVSVCGDQAKVANGKLKNIYEDMVQWILAKDKILLGSLYDRLLGRMSAQGQIDFRYKDKARNFRSRAQNLDQVHG